jgi:hypothetical protein
LVVPFVRRMLRVLLAVVTLIAFTGGARAEYFCFGMQRTMARCCCPASTEHESANEPFPSVDRAPCCERRIKEVTAPVGRFDGGSPSVPKAPLATVMSDPFVVHPGPANVFASLRPVDWGPRAGPDIALYARTSRYLI